MSAFPCRVTVIERPRCSDRVLNVSMCTSLTPSRVALIPFPFAHGERFLIAPPRAVHERRKQDSVTPISLRDGRGRAPHISFRLSRSIESSTEKDAPPLRLVRKKTGARVRYGGGARVVAPNVRTRRVPLRDRLNRALTAAALTLLE